jgi:rare lipoprotein A
MKKTETIIIFCLLIAVSAGAQTPLPENGGFRQEGLASWYGAEFAGRPTASGQIFDPSKFTAAHPKLDFGTVLTVTNLVNNKQVQVTVNDRGPFAGGRIIDVSRAAAEKLDMVETGVTQVVIEVVPRYANSGATVSDAAAGLSSNAGSSVNSAASDQGANSDENTYYPVQRPAVSADGGVNTAPASPRASAAPSNTAQGRSSSTAAPVIAPLPIPPPPRTTGPIPQSSSAGSVPATSVPKNIPVPTAGTPRPANPAEAARSSITQAPPQAPSAAQSVNSDAVTPKQIQPVQGHSTPAAPPSYQPLPLVTPQFPLPDAAKQTYEAPSPTTKAPAVTPAAPPAVSNTNSLATTPPVAPVGPGVNVKPQVAPAEIKGGPVVPGRVYRLQIGSFKTPKNAVETFDRLSNAGLNPSWEPFGEYYRIVLTGIKSEDVPVIAEKLREAGFKEAVARIEAYEE